MFGENSHYGNFCHGICTCSQDASVSLLCVLQTGLERVVRMGLTIGLIVWVFQSQAEMDRRVYRNYIDIRKYAYTSCLDLAKAQHTAVP